MSARTQRSEDVPSVTDPRRRGRQTGRKTSSSSVLQSPVNSLVNLSHANYLRPRGAGENNSSIPPTQGTEL